MARVFSLPTVLRQVPNRLLRQFFEKRRVPLPGVYWNDLRERDVQPILEGLASLNSAELLAVEAELRSVFEMGCEAGIRALGESAAALEDHDLIERLPPEDTAYGQAMWVWLHHPDYFAQAGLLFQVDRLTWWRKRNDLPDRPARTDPATLECLRRDVSRLLLREQGRGKLCSVEVLERGDTAYYFLYPDDFVLSLQVHDEDGRLAPRSVRRTFHIVFAYRAAAGSLELFAKVPAPLKPKLEEIFARTVLETDLEAWQSPAAFHLQHLRFRTTQLPVDPRDAVSVAVRRMQFEIVGTKRRLVLEGDPEGGPRDVYAMIDEYLDRERLRVEDLRVRSATLAFAFADLGDRLPGTASVDVAVPNGCNLRNQRPERVEIVQKYLVAWGIDVRPGGPRPAPTGRCRAAAVA